MDHRVNEMEGMIVMERDRVLRELDELEILVQKVEWDEFKLSLDEVKEVVSLNIEENFEEDCKSPMILAMNQNEIVFYEIGSTAQSIPIEKSECCIIAQAMVSALNYFFCIGGCSTIGQASKFVSIYNFEGKLIQKSELLKTPRKFSAVLEVNQKLFVIGGCKSSGKGVDSVEIIDCQGFSHLGSFGIPQSRGYTSACFFKGFVYFAGSENSYLTKFDPESVLSSKVKTKNVESGDLEKIVLVVQAEEFLVVFKERQYFVLDGDEKVKFNVRLELGIKWAQCQAVVFKKELYVKDYFSGELIKVKLQLP